LAQPEGAIQEVPVTAAFFDYLVGRQQLYEIFVERTEEVEGEVLRPQIRRRFQEESEARGPRQHVLEGFPIERVVHQGAAGQGRPGRSEDRRHESTHSPGSRVSPGPRTDPSRRGGNRSGKSRLSAAASARRIPEVPPWRSAACSRMRPPPSSAPAPRPTPGGSSPQLA